MSVLIIDPHGDDCALFCAYSALKEKPDLLLTHATVPWNEINMAASPLEVRNIYHEIGEWRGDVTKVYAPAPHEDGHDEHNEAWELAWELTQSLSIPLVSYCTYAPRAVRQTGTLVEPEPWMVARKLRALSCFVSQIEQESTRPWFTYLLDVREWISEN